MQVFRFDNDGDWLFMRKPWKLSVHYIGGLRRMPGGMN